MDMHAFGFPFEPYPIQRDFMKELYNVLSEGKIGIFESPTGTVRLSRLLDVLLVLLTYVFEGQIIESYLWIIEMAERLR